MTAYKPLHAPPAPPREPSALALFFRRAIAAVRRKPAVPADLRPAGAAGGSDWDDAMPARFACCVHCEDGCPCDPPDSHLASCGDGCNAAVPVLGDRMLSQVRQQWNAFHDDTERAAPAPWRKPRTPGGPVFKPSSAMSTGEFRLLDKYVDEVLSRPVNGRSLPDQPRQQPVYGEVPQLDVERAAARAAGERARERYEPASPELLAYVRAGLEKL